MDRPYQAEEAQRTGISNLKVGFNKVFGYYLEITNTHGHKIPAHYIRKQTVKNAERYITPELKEYEEKVLTADEQAKELEYELFVELRELRRRASPPLASHGGGAGPARCAGGLAELARSARLLPARHSSTSRSCRSSTAGIRCSMSLTTEGTFVPNDASCGGGRRD